MAFKNRLRVAINVESLLNMLDSLLFNALRFAKQAQRTYRNPTGTWSTQGPWDADLVDHVHNEAQRFIDSGVLNAQELQMVLNYRAGHWWIMGHFENAVRDQEALLATYEGKNPSPKVLDSIQRALELMRQNRNPADILDYESSNSSGA